MQQRTENGRLETVSAPARNCYYTGSVADHQFSRIAVSVCDDEMVRKQHHIMHACLKLFATILSTN